MKKLIALAAVAGVATWLMKSEKGAEIRKNVADKTGEWKDKLVDSYKEMKDKSQKGPQTA